MQKTKKHLKIIVESMRNPWKNVSIFWLIFWLIFGRFLGGFWDAFWHSKSMKNASKNWWKKWVILACFFEWKSLPNGKAGRLKKDLKWEPKWHILLGPLLGRVWGGFWMDLGSILGGFWRDLRALGSPNGHENLYVSKEIQVLPLGFPKGGFGQGPARI